MRNHIERGGLGERPTQLVADLDSALATRTCVQTVRGFNQVYLGLSTTIGKCDVPDVTNPGQRRSCSWTKRVGNVTYRVPRLWANHQADVGGSRTQLLVSIGAVAREIELRWQQLFPDSYNNAVKRHSDLVTFYKLLRDTQRHPAGMFP